MVRGKSWKVSTVILILFLAISTRCTPLTLGTNLLINSGFQTPAFNTNTTWFVDNPPAILGWTCINKCELVGLPYACSSVNSSYCSMVSNNQMINLQSSTNENITQHFNITNNSTYLLSFQWLPPQMNALTNKSMAVLVNSYKIDTVVINSTNYQIASINSYSKEINLTAGSNTLKFVMLGPGDGYGHYLDNVQLQEIMASNSSSVNNANNSSNFNTSLPQNTSSSSTNNTNNSSNFNSSLPQNTSFPDNSLLPDNSSLPADSTTSSSKGFIKQNSELLLEALMNNKFNSFMNAIPGSRIFFTYLMGYYINFDRLQLYYYHKQNFTEYATIFLYAIYLLKQQQGSLVQELLTQQSNLPVCSATISYELNLANILDYKANYTSQYISSKNANGDSFVANELHFFFYQLPSMVLGFCILLLVFNLVKEYRASILLRKYCFLGMFFFLAFEGNLEELAFYYFNECKLFFSACITHKFINLFLVIFGFLMIFFVFGCSLFFYGYYRKRAKYFIEDYRFMLQSFVSVCIESGIAPLVSACIHTIFLEQLFLLTALLVLMETAWIVVRAIFLWKKVFTCRTRAFIHVVNNFLRIFFLITLYLYENGGDESTINDFHCFFMVSYLFLWGFELLINLITITSSLYTFIRKSCRANRVNNLSRIQAEIQCNSIHKKRTGITQTTNGNWMIRSTMAQRCLNFQKKGREHISIDVDHFLKLSKPRLRRT